MAYRKLRDTKFAKKDLDVINGLNASGITLDELLAPAQPCPEELLDVSTFDQDICRLEADHGMTETLDSVMEQLKSLTWMGQGHGKMSPEFCLMLDSIGPLE